MFEREPLLCQRQGSGQKQQRSFSECDKHTDTHTHTSTFTLTHTCMLTHRRRQTEVKVVRVGPWQKLLRLPPPPPRPSHWGWQQCCFLVLELRRRMKRPTSPSIPKPQGVPGTADISTWDIRKDTESDCSKPPSHPQARLCCLSPRWKAKFHQETCLQEATHLPVPAPGVTAPTDDLKIELSTTPFYARQFSSASQMAFKK